MAYFRFRTIIKFSYKREATFCEWRCLRFIPVFLHCIFLSVHITYNACYTYDVPKKVRSPCISVISMLACDLAVPGLSPGRGGYLADRKRCFSAHSLLLLPKHCPHMTQTLLERTLNDNHPSINQKSQNYQSLADYFFYTFAGYVILRCSKVTITGTNIASVEPLVPHFSFAHMCHMTLAVCVNNLDTMVT